MLKLHQEEVKEGTEPLFKGMPGDALNESNLPFRPEDFERELETMRKVLLEARPVGSSVPTAGQGADQRLEPSDREGGSERRLLRNSYWGGKLTEKVEDFLQEVRMDASEREDIPSTCRSLRDRVVAIYEEMDFAPLYEKNRQLFSIGYNTEEGRLTGSYYDLLASEARLTSYIAIAGRSVDRSHWTKLGRRLGCADGAQGLLSWTGTMFEYLMPCLVMKSYENTLLAQAAGFALTAQKAYASRRGIPWGISESGYHEFDISLNYQYKAFGIPELGLKRGLHREVVVSPYSTMLALGMDTHGAQENLERLRLEGMEGRYGFYEALDFTPGRAGRNGRAQVKSYMAHHQGMSLAALNNLLGGNLLQERFHRNPVIRSADELLQEKITRVGSSRRNHRVRKQDLNFKKMVGDDGRTRKEGKDFALRKGEMPQGPLPRVHLLTNGAYSLMINDGGSGYSKLRDIMVCRWQGGSGAVAGGQYVFIQNLNSNEAWSATLEPMLAIPDSYHTVFSPDKAEFVRRDGNIEARTEIAVSPEDNAEIRRITLTNHSEHTRELQLTSYFEIVLTTGEADAAHPSFSNLFVMTEFLEDKEALLAVRRPRDGSACKPWLIHTAVCEGKGIGGLQYETDRMKFIGRNRNLQNPAAMDVTQPLSNSAGASIDPVMSLRRRVILGPGQSANVVFVTALGETREEALEMADKYRNPTSFTRAFMLSRTRCDIEGDYLGLNWEEVREYLEALSHLLYNSPSRRLIKDSLAKNRKGQPGLWQYGISGDRPVMLLTLHDMADVEMAVWGLKATEFWRSRGIRSDLLLLVFEPGGYAQPLLDACREALSAAGGRAGGVKRDGIFILNGTQLPEEDILLFHAASSLVLKGGGGAVGEQLGLRLERTEAAISVPHPSDGNGQPGTEYPEIRPAFKSGNAPSNTKAPWPNMEKTVATLQFYNGLAGFSQDGKEYVIFAGEGHRTPAPWINVISNPGFGFCISESGGGYTWAENSRENKLTPWSNDPVMDPPGEILYLRDEEDGAFWSLTPQPAGGEIQYEVRHGMGYTIFKHETGGLGVSLTVFAAGVDPVKLWMIRINNLTGRDRKVSAFYYIRPVLGERPGKTSRTIVTESGDRDGMIFITNTFSHDFPGRVAFIGSSEITAGSTGDEMEFIGRNGSLQNPKALSRARLSGALGAGYEPCAALQTDFVIEKEKEKKLLFIIGQGRSKEEATELAARYGRYEAAEEELRKIAAGWEKRLTALQVETPDPSMNILLNGWLLYQVTSCRLWGRSAFYQSGGAYGFRDQLQDVTALIYACPDTVKKQLLHHAGHQFPEGDVQHWWHEESGKGIRTRYSDDLVWLPYVVADYIEHTGDWDILDSRVGYLSSEPLPDGEDERYEIPGHGQTTESLYLHCIRALERALRFGEHGIPLMGCGDWNDGMNRVGNKGRGESVWLGWFLITVLKKFIPICRNTGDEAKATDFENAMNSMSTALEKSAWDGSWYRRAYFDDGKPLGASANSECQIDSISQSWAVISGVCRKARTDEAMNAADSYLVDRENGLIRLLTPPFDKGDLEPGYIKGYIPGVRENGGQYTHAAVWLIIAHALRGDGDKAWELYHMVNPINHGRTAMECGKYRVEPYVMSADVYGYSPHAGRGGWSWYTGAAAWMYRAGIEHMLGLRKRGGELTVVPCIPKTWKGYVMDYRYGSATYRIKVENPGSMNKGVVFVSVDEKEAADGVIPLKDDGDIHEVRVVMG